MTRIEVETRDGKVAVQVPEDDLDIEEFIGNLVRPALLALGYHPDTVEGALGGE